MLFPFFSSFSLENFIALNPLTPIAILENHLSPLPLLIFKHLTDKGKKFNAKKETALGENYYGIKIFRFYIVRRTLHSHSLWLREEMAPTSVPGPGVAAIVLRGRCVADPGQRLEVFLP